MEHYTRNMSSTPSSPVKFAHTLPEKPLVPMYWAEGDMPRSDGQQHRNQIAPSHIKTNFTPEAVAYLENLPSASAHSPSQSRPRRRSVQEIFYKLGLADPTPDMPSLSSPSSMLSASTWTSPAMRTPVQHISGQDAVFGHNRSNSRRGRGRNMPSGRLTCRSWFMHGECDKPPGQCQYMHMHIGQGVSPLPSMEIHGQPIEEEIICRTDFMVPVPNFRHYEAHSPELEDFESPSDGPLVVGPRSFSQPYELRAKIYSIVALNTNLQGMVQNPQTPVVNRSGTRRNAATSPLSVELNKARDLVQELYAEFQTYHTVIQQIQPRLLDFAEPLRKTAHAMNMTYRELSLLEHLNMVADEIRVIIGRHRVAEWLTVDGKKS